PYTLFFYHAPPPTDIYPLSLHDALPIYRNAHLFKNQTRKGGHPASVCAYGRECTILLLQDDVDFIVKPVDNGEVEPAVAVEICGDRKSTRLNSSHDQISYAVFCLKKKKI